MVVDEKRHKAIDFDVVHELKLKLVPQLPLVVAVAAASLWIRLLLS